MKQAFAFLSGILAGAMLVMVYLHRGVIAAIGKGEPLPEAPEGCPAFNKPCQKAD